jgi:hypothetical protein
MVKVKFFMFLLVAGIAVQNVYAFDLNSALQKTQACLKNRNCDSLLSDAGKAADQNALAAVAGNADDQQKLYDLAAKVMPILTQQANGDPLKLQALLTKAQADPQGFINSLPPSLQAQLSNMAATLLKNQAPAHQP